jgi:hypothetical protein
MKTTFCTREFERSHGHKPRGTGVWAFMPAEGGDPCDWVFTPCMTFTEAKQYAKTAAPDCKAFKVGP